MSSGWAGGSSTRWRKRIRPAVIARDGYQCKRCGIPTHDQGAVHGYPSSGCRACIQIHHLDGTSGGRPDAVDPARLEAWCRGCNLTVGDPTGPRFLREGGQNTPAPVRFPPRTMDGVGSR